MVAHGASRGRSAAVSNQPGGRHIEGSGRFIEVSPSGLKSGRQPSRLGRQESPDVLTPACEIDEARGSNDCMRIGGGIDARRRRASVRSPDWTKQEAD